MEGLLLLLFLFVALSKGKKKRRKAVLKPDAQARNKARKAAAVHNEQMRSQLNLADFLSPDRPEPWTEGLASSEGSGQTEIYRGSLNVQTAEGECMCDPSLEHERKAYSDPDSVYATEIRDAPVPDFTPQGIMQGVVMSEILARPSQRFLR